MNAYELAKYLNRLNGYMDMPRDILDITQPSADMLRQQADRIAELEKEVLMWKNAEVPTEVMADLIQELERRQFITTPQIKELSDEEIADMVCSGEYWELSERQVIIAVHFDKFARAILKKARNN